MHRIHVDTNGGNTWGYQVERVKCADLDSRMSVVLLESLIHDIVHLSLPMISLVLLTSQPTLSDTSK
jgi:hypothetical protein